MFDTLATNGTPRTHMTLREWCTRVEAVEREIEALGLPPLPLIRPRLVDAGAAYGNYARAADAYSFANTPEGHARAAEARAAANTDGGAPSKPVHAAEPVSAPKRRKGRSKASRRGR
jgi:hypothetical protein